MIWCKNAIRTKSVKSEGKKKSKSEDEPMVRSEELWKD